MFQTKKQDATLEITTLDEIRRQIGMGLMLIIGFGIIGFNLITAATGVGLGSNAEDTLQSIIPILLIGFSSLGFVLLRQRRFVTIVLYFPIVSFIALSFNSTSTIAFPIFVFFVPVYAGLVTRLPFFVIITATFIIQSVIYQQSSTDYPYMLFTISGVVTGMIVYYAIDRFSTITQQSTRTNNLLRASSDIAQVINRDLDLQQLLDNTVNTIRDEFNFYHVQIFLIDDEYEYANLIASTGEAGKQLLARNHRLPVGSQSVIGRVSQVGEPVIAQNTSADTVHALNELLPDTRSELALPIIDASNIVGALDVQSIHADAFQTVDVQALQIVTNQLSVAIRNARLFKQAQQNIQENKQLLFEYETNLRQVDRLNRTLTKQSWDTYLNQTVIEGVTLSGQRILPQAEWSDAMRAAAQDRQTQVEAKETAKVITVPIILRDQILGAIEVEIEEHEHASDSVEMMQAISQRLAVSLESARLFEETQEATLQEQQINEIVSSYETAVTIDELLQVTLERLQQALGAEKGAVRLGTGNPNNTNPHLHNGNGGTPS